MPRRHKRKKKAIMFLFAVIFLFMMFSAVKANKLIRPIVIQQSEHFSEKTASEITEKAVSEYLKNNRHEYCDYAAVLYNEEKQVTSIETISYSINKLQSELTLLINCELEKSGSKNAEIPVGSLTKTYILNGKGPKIHIRICPVGSADVKMKSELVSSGINQTKHRISAVINVKMTSSTPLFSYETNSEFEFLIAENIIVGEVPQLNHYRTAS